MAIHLTPTELAREAGMERREVIEKCMEMGVPIFQGRIDKTLFLANLSNLEVVLLGGGWCGVHTTAPPQVRSRLNRNGLPACREHVRLRTPALWLSPPSQW